mgnify:CR=1 FL=1
MKKDPSESLILRNHLKILKNKISKIKLLNGCDFDLREENLIESDNKFIGLEFNNQENNLQTNNINLEKILNAAEIKNTSPPPHGAKRPVASIEGSNKIIYGKYNISILLIALIIFIYLVFFLLFIIN